MYHGADEFTIQVENKFETNNIMVVHLFKIHNTINYTVFN